MKPRGEYARLLGDHAGFRRLWLADLLSLFGDWFSWIALYTAVDSLLGTSSAVGLVLVAKTLPFVFVSPFAGPLVDRLPARALMVAADVARAVFGGVLVLAWELGSVPLLFVAMVLSVLCAGVFLPAKNAAIPRLLPADRVAAANALTAGNWSVTLAFGAALGGLVTETFGVSTALALDALTYLASAALLVGLPPLAPDAPTTARDARFSAALRWLAARRGLWPMVLAKSGMACTTGALPMITIYGNRLLSTAPSPWTVGVLFAARGIGAAVGSLGARRVFGDAEAGLRRMTVAGFAMLALGYAWFAVAADVATCGAALAVVGVGNSLVWVGSNVLIQTCAERRFHGRLFALDFGAMTCASAVAVLATTTAVDALVWTPRLAVGAAAIAAVPVGAIMWVGLWPNRSRRAVAPVTDRNAPPPRR